MKKIFIITLVLSIFVCPPINAQEAQPSISAYSDGDWFFNGQMWEYRLYINYQQSSSQSLGTWGELNLHARGYDTLSYIRISPTRIYVMQYLCGNSESWCREWVHNDLVSSMSDMFLWSNFSFKSNPTVLKRIESSIINFGSLAPAALIPKTVVSNKMSMTKDPINLATGEMIIQASDISLKGRGPALSLVRTFRSQSTFSGLFGYCWRSAYDINLTKDVVGNVTIFDEKGVAIYFYVQPNGGYVPSLGNHSFLTKNADGTYTLLDEHGIVTTYNATGRFSKIIDRNGNTLSFVYNPTVNGGTYIQDTTGQRILLGLDSGGRIISAQDPAGRTIFYGYDANSNLSLISDAAGKKTSYVYNSDHNIIESTNGNGHKTYFAYDINDRAYMNWQDGNVNKVTLDFQSAGITVATDSLGNKNTYQFNDYGLETLHTDPLGSTTSQTWDDKMNRTSVVDAKGNMTQFTYDSIGNLTQINDAFNNKTRMGYNAEFNLISSTLDAKGQSKSFGYDSRGNLTNMTDALGKQRTITYNQFGEPLTEKDTLGRTVTFTYNNLGQVIQQTDPLGKITSFTYDNVGNVLTKTDALGRKTTFNYDNLNRLVKATFADNSTILYSYDAFGNQIKITDQRGNPIIKEYDTYERLVKTTDPLGGITQSSYDSEGHLLTVTDAKGNLTRYAYDSNGRIVIETNPLGFASTNVYDKVGNLIAKIDNNNQTITYTYDALNRLIDTIYPDGTKVTNVYDQLGQKISMTDARGLTTYTYDALGRLLSEDGPEANDTITYTYDSEGNRLTMVDQNGQKTTYAYDSLNRLASVTDIKGTTLYTYDAVSNKLSVKYPNTTSEIYTYDVMNRPTLVNNIANKNTVISSFKYTYDLAGMVTSKQYKDGSIIQYTYDALNQLLRETKSSSTSKQATVIYDYVYTYDLLGNRLSFKKSTTLGNFWTVDSKIMPQKVLTDMTAAGFGNTKGTNLSQAITLTKNLQYDFANRLLNWSHSVNISTKSFPIETVTYLYDKNGNRTFKERVRSGETAKQQIQYNYDAEDRLKGLDYTNIPGMTGVQHDTFVYDGTGTRTQTVENNVKTSSYYDGFNVVIERDDLGKTKNSYTRGLGFSGGIGSLISQTTATATQYYHYDALGSVANMVSSTGAATASYEYDAFGNLVNPPSASDTNLFRFSSKKFESRSGLYYFGARYYDAEVGRWLTRDPLGFADGMNPYLYVNNNPINLVDPYGLCGERRNSWVDFFFDQNTFGDSIKLWQASGGDVGLKSLAVIGVFATITDAGFNIASGGSENTIKKGILVLGRGPKVRLERLAREVGGYISTIASQDARTIWKNNKRDIRMAEKIIQYMDKIDGGAFSRAERIYIDSSDDLLKKTERIYAGDAERWGIK